MTRVRLTPSEAKLPAYLAAVGIDLYSQGWRFPTQPPRAYLSAVRDLPAVPRSKQKQGRYYLLLGAAALKRPSGAVPPCAKSCPQTIVVRTAEHPGPNATLRVTLACARGLPARPAPSTSGRHRVCLRFSLATRCALEAALRKAPGTTLAEWVRHCLGAVG